ncbi:MAG TPA: R3H domain-containing nucleic acid-binding protein [Chthonomonadaceae bacterium]|nr:R3H domain-containing nucleic acid-binding protein [Chthonomonadaceae bacterium]
MTDLHAGQPESAAEGTPTGAAESMAGPVDLNADQGQAVTVMEEVCAASGLDIHPVVRAVHDPYLDIELVGSDTAITFGRLGPALDQLQFLANLILARRIRSDVRIILDAANYRERRAEVLRRRAIELANEVKARNEEAELEPLPPHERRIIHKALADDPDIMTYSEGEEPDRRIVISPRR